MDEQRKWFAQMESILAEDAVNTAKMITKDLKEYVNLVHKTLGRV